MHTCQYDVDDIDVVAELEDIDAHQRVLQEGCSHDRIDEPSQQEYARVRVLHSVRHSHAGVQTTDLLPHLFSSQVVSVSSEKVAEEYWENGDHHEEEHGKNSISDANG